MLNEQLQLVTSSLPLNMLSIIENVYSYKMLFTALHAVVNNNDKTQVISCMVGLLLQNFRHK